MTEPDISHLLTQAVTHHQANELAEAQALYQQLLQHDPQNINALHLLGVCAFQQGDSQTSVVWIKQAIAIDPNFPEFYVNLANSLQALKQYEQAISYLQQAITLDPNYAEVYFSLGNILASQAKYEDSINAYKTTISLNSQHWITHHHLGHILQKLNRYEEAISLYQKILGHDPNNIDAYYNLANSLRNIKQFDQAIDAYQKTILLNPNHANAYFQLAKLFNNEQSIDYYDKAIQINTSYKKSVFNEAIIYLNEGKLREGFYLYENRWAEYDSPQHTPHSLWLGKEPINGKNLLILYEQGLGDTIQMIRYVSLLQKMNVCCWIQIPISLLSLMQRSFDNVKWIPLQPAFSKDTFLVALDSIEGVDYCTYTMSLPLAMKTFYEIDIPKHIPYLIADTEKCRHWENKLVSSSKLKVGLVWRGNPANPADHHRSIPLAAITALFNISDIQFITIQKDLTNDEKAILSSYDNVISYDEELIDFDETAALIMNLDIVISICSSPAHLSAALGKTTWIILSANADWRWMQQRIDSPWYPTAELIRQKSIGDWSSITNEISDKLKAQIYANQ